MPLKICFLSVLHPYNDTRIFHKEACSLVEAGFDVTHLASGEPASFEEEGVHIQRYSPITHNPILGRLTRLWPLYRQALKNDADVYHCNEIESWIVGCLIKITHPRKKIVFDVHEHYPSFFENPFYPKWVRYIGEPLTLFLYRILTPLTDYIVIALPSFAKDFRKAREKIVTISNYASLKFCDLQYENVAEEIKARYGKGKIAIHTGSIARSRGWPELLQAISQMKYPNLSVLFLGDIPNAEEIYSAAQRLGIADRVIFHEKVSYKEMMNLILLADIGLILYLPDLKNHILAWPTKFCDYMMARLPVIAPKSMERVAEAINMDQTGILVDPSNPDDIAIALDYLCLNELQAEEMGKRGYQAVKGKYNWEVEAQKLAEIYTNISKGIRSL